MHPLVVRAAAAALFATTALAAPPAQAGLSLEQALQLAATQSRQLAARDAQASAARDMALAAGQRPDPQLKLGIANLPLSGPDRFSLTNDFMTMRNVGVMQEFTRSAKLQARSARYAREADVALAERALALAMLRKEAATAWLDAAFAGQQRVLVRSQLAEAQLQVQAADAAYRGARGSQADALAARQAVAQMEDRLAQVERDLALARTRLARWVGDAAASEPLDAPPPMDRLPAAMADGELAGHPEITALARREDLAQADVTVAQAAKETDVSVEVMYSQRGPAYANMLSVNLSIPLQWDQKNRQDRELAARVANATQAHEEREDMTRAHAAELRLQTQQWQADQARLARYDSVQLPLAEQRVQAALTAYRGGTGTLTAVLEARRAQLDLAQERLRLQADNARLWAQLTLPYTDHTNHAGTAALPPSTPKAQP